MSIQPQEEKSHGYRNDNSLRNDLILVPVRDSGNRRRDLHEVRIVNRYRTIQCYDGTTIAQDESEQAACPSVDDAIDNESGVADWVWQFADSKEQAIAQHDAKIDAWHENPNLETY